MIIRLLRRSAETGMPADPRNREPGPGAEWWITAEPEAGGDRPHSIALSGWPQAQPEAFAAVTEGILEFLDSPDAVFGEMRAVADGDRLVVGRGLAVPGTEASVMSAARAWVLMELAARRISSAVIGRHGVAGRVELVIARVGPRVDPPPAEVAGLFQGFVSTGYRVTGADMRRPAHGGGPALR